MSNSQPAAALVVAAAGIAAMIWLPLEDYDAAIGVAPAAPAEEVPVDDPVEDPVEEPVEDPVIEEPGPVTDDAGEEFAWMPAGDLIEGSGDGQTEQMNYAPGMRFPMEAGQAYSNSQVYNYGGYLGPAGGQCNADNYAYSWRDNFCETRGYGTPMCPAGTGHQGQDIRPATCDDEVHWAVAAEAGTITSIGTYSVRLTTDEGVRYTYLHLDKPSLLVEEGDAVARGERLGFVSNEFGDTSTTIHLHFEIRMSVDTGSGLQNTHVPPYLALVDSYERLLAGDEG
ncbi:MAG: M23 family metallopeptidase [Maricaulis sp.]|jgi:hypothetical protein|nr:M23 family metallopeptidase [Maricaulis sp.]MDG2043071.1 M23 family metallopeptidase [Maricaulis sp.]